MTRVLLWLPLALFAGLLAVVATGIWKPADRTVHSTMVGKPLPRFAAPAMLPAKPGVTSAILTDGRPHLLNIFASWCIPCAAEAPQLIRLKQLGVTVEGLAVRDESGAVGDFLRHYGDPFAAIGSDREARVQLALGSSGVPESFVIDGKGHIVLQHIGDIRAEDVDAIAAAVKGAR